MIYVAFKRLEEGYQRTLTLPGGGRFEDKQVAIKPSWLSQGTWSWIRDFAELSKEELIKEGSLIAHALLGNEGLDYIRGNGQDKRICLYEDPGIPEISKVPWELCSIEGEFALVEHGMQLSRLPQNIDLKERVVIGTPLRLAILSASPKDQNPLMVEEELLALSLALDQPISAGNILFDEVYKCTRRKLDEVLRSNDYDMVCFTGHGAFEQGQGFLVFENPRGEADPISAQDFARTLRRRQEQLPLVFLNCCNAGSVGGANETMWQRGFGDVARRLLASGVAEVIATQAAIYDSTGRKFMNAFFEELCLERKYDVAGALGHARSQVENDLSQFHDFYHFVHFSTLGESTEIESIHRQDAAEYDPSASSQRVACESEHRPVLDHNFVGRFSYISEIEDLWWRNSVKTLGLHGLGGIGKTFLAARMQELTLRHPVPEKRFEHSIWIDFREDKGSTLSGFLMQLSALAHSMGFPAYQRVLDNHEKYPSPYHKFKPLCDHLQSQYGGKVLLILDNLESAVDPEGEFEDPELAAWFRELTARMPRAAKVLVTSRHYFDFFPDGRRLCSAEWLHLAELGMTERLCLLNFHHSLRDIPQKERGEILASVGGNPFIIGLVANYLQRNPHLDSAITRASQKGAQYAQLDGFISMLSDQAKEWLYLMAIFPKPILMDGLLNTMAIRDSIEAGQSLADDLNGCLTEIADLSLAKPEANSRVDIHPLVAYQVLNNPESHYQQSADKVLASQRAIGIFYIILATEHLDKVEHKVAALLQGIEPALKQPELELILAYLEQCTALFLGHVPVSVFGDIVRRAKSRLLESVSEGAMHILALCAQTLMEMRDFKATLEILNSILEITELTDSMQSMIHGIIGKAYQAQREWEAALNNYNQSLEWGKKTENFIEMGRTFHQIGIVYTEQREWDAALKNYHRALEWNEKTENYIGMGGTFHQIGIVHAEQRKWEAALQNYSHALEWNKKTENYIHMGKTFHQIGRVYEEQGEWEAALKNYNQALEWNKKTENYIEMGATFHQIGIVHEKRREWEAALMNYSQALEWNEKTENYIEISSTFHQIGRLNAKQGEWEAALMNYSQALECNKKTENYIEMSRTFQQIGVVYAEQRKWQAALENYSQALEWDERTENYTHMSGPYHLIGRVHEERGEWEAALMNYSQALKWNKKTENYIEMGATFHQIGIVHAEQRKWEAALMNYSQALKWNKKTENYIQLGLTFHQIGRVYEEQGEWEAALKNYNQALEWNKKTENYIEMGDTFHQIGTVYAEKGEWEAALKNYNQALRWKKKTKNYIEIGKTYHNIGMVHAEQGEWEEALRNYNQALEWNNKTANYIEIGSTFHQIGIVYESQGEWEAALENYNQALEWKKKTENYLEMGSTFHQIGMVYEELGDIDKCFEMYRAAYDSAVQAGKAKAHEAEIIIESMLRVMPDLTPQQQAELRGMLPADLFQSDGENE